MLEYFLRMPKSDDEEETREQADVMECNGFDLWVCMIRTNACLASAENDEGIISENYKILHRFVTRSAGKERIRGEKQIKREIVGMVSVADVWPGPTSVCAESTHARQAH